IIQVAHRAGELERRSIHQYGSLEESGGARDLVGIAFVEPHDLRSCAQTTRAHDAVVARFRRQRRGGLRDSDSPVGPHVAGQVVAQTAKLIAPSADGTVILFVPLSARTEAGMNYAEDGLTAFALDQKVHCDFNDASGGVAAARYRAQPAIGLPDFDHRL